MVIQSPTGDTHSGPLTQAHKGHRCVRAELSLHLANRTNVCVSSSPGDPAASDSSPVTTHWWGTLALQRNMGHRGQDCGAEGLPPAGTQSRLVTFPSLIPGFPPSVLNCLRVISHLICPSSSAQWLLYSRFAHFPKMPSALRGRRTLEW